jgi:hypothetical protein
MQLCASSWTQRERSLTLRLYSLSLVFTPAALFLSFPSVITHHVDIYSLLHPPRESPVNPSGITLRHADSVIGNRREFVCPCCGESYGSFNRLCTHVKYVRSVEKKEGYPILGTHQALDESDFLPNKPKKYSATTDLDELREHFAREVSEVICVVEGIEPSSSGTFAALQSYMFEDIVFQAGGRFCPCVEAVDGDKSKRRDDFVRVDLDSFHGIESEESAGAPVGSE